MIDLFWKTVYFKTATEIFFEKIDSLLEPSSAAFHQQSIVPATNMSQVAAK